MATALTIQKGTEIPTFVSTALEGFDALDMIPKEEENSINPPTPVEVDDKESEPEPVLFQEESRIVVVGDSYFPTNALMAFQGLNQDFFLNCLAWLTEEKSLITVRAKDLQDTPLTVTYDQQRFVLTLTVLVIPFLVIMIGIFVSVLRKRSA